MIPPILTYGFVLFFGMCVGSFLNVCVYRMPKGLSVVSPPSSCPVCKTAIKWYDNIPVISWLMLRGRCRGCKTPISIRYPVIELLTGMFAWITVIKYGLTWPALIYFIFIAALLVITFVDLDLMIIPNRISLPGIPLGFAASFILTEVTWLDSLIGIGIGWGSLWIVGTVFKRVRKKEGMGFGDVKLLAMIGAFIGWEGVLFTIMASSFTGTAVGLIGMILARKGLDMKMPFGPFLAIGAILYIFLGPQLIGWYLNIN